MGGAVGTHLLDNLRVELEVAYSENDADTYGSTTIALVTRIGKFEFLTFMGNIWLDVPLTDDSSPIWAAERAWPSLNADGIGYANDDAHFDGSEAAFAVQAGAGLRWQLAEWITLDVGYRFRIIEGPEFNANTDHVPGAVTDFDVDWIGSHNVIGGISFGF